MAHRGVGVGALLVMLLAGCGSDDSTSPGSDGGWGVAGYGGFGGSGATGGTTAHGGGAAAGGLPQGGGGSGAGSAGGGGSGPSEGEITFLTYNVAALPQFISGSDPIQNIPQISPLLNLYELALVQEDFAYQELLRADALHPYQSEPLAPNGVNLGDGLNRFSMFPFVDFERHAWAVCNGYYDQANDCLTDKGFSVGLHTFGPGAEVDIYNAHFDAGSSDGDLEAREAQTDQILATIATRSAGRAVIVAGDTNMGSSSEYILQTLLTGASLEDSCRVLDCGEESRIDRVMYRSSASVRLEATSWLIDLRFVDGDGEPLSDHEAVGVTMSWEKL